VILTNVVKLHWNLRLGGSKIAEIQGRHARLLHHCSNVTWRFRFSFQFLRVADCENWRRLLRVRAPEQYWALEFGLNLNQWWSGVGTAFPHLFL